MRTPLVPLALAVLLAAPAAAQRPRVHAAPARPALVAGADTNSANAYYIYGSQNLERDPQRAAAAFYWAYRLNPRMADALYGRRVALLLTDRSRLLRYMEGNRGTIRSPEIQAIDSLQLRALTIDPFLVQKFDKTLLTAWLTESLSREMSRAGETNPALASHLIQTWLNSSTGDPFMKAWFAYAEGRYPQALGEYERALRRARNKSRLRTDVGRLHYLSGTMEQALQHLSQAVQEMKQEDEREIVYLYESKALLEQSVGAVHEKQGNVAAAREAYGRALTEDLSYYPAHMRLGWLALAAGDTASALSELALAAEVAANDGYVHYEHGVLLAVAKKYEEAVAALKKSIELEPYFAGPHFVLARIHDGSGMPEAVQNYRDYLARTPQDDPQRRPVERRLAELGVTN